MLKFYQTIRFKILTCCICISIIPTLIIFIFTLNKYTQVYTSQIESVTKNTVQNATESIKRNFDNIDSLETALIFSRYGDKSIILSICDQENAVSHPSPNQRLQNDRAFEYVCSNLIRNSVYAEGVYLFTNSGYTYSFVKNSEFWLGDASPDADWRKALNNKDGSIVQPFVPKYSDSGRKYLMFAKKFKNLAGKATGTLVIVCDNSILGLANGNSSDGNVGVILPNGEMLSNSSQTKLSLSKDQLAKISSQTDGYVSDSSHDIIAFGTLKNLGWKTISKVSLDPFYSAYEQNRTFFIWIMAIVMIIVALLVYGMERMFVRPLVYLSHSMSISPKSGIAYFKNTCPNRKDEIGILYNCFDKMLSQIHKLIEDKYKSEIRYLKSRLKNLMAQINAHFLFNTLENINDCAIIEHNQKIAIMSKSLGDILRYSIDYETDEVPLQTELEQAQNYINIQEVKFGHPIRFTIDVERNLLQHKVMKFFLQPIIENAIEHGLSGKLAEGEIKLKAFRRDGVLHIIVFDNGSSIPEDRLEKIRQTIRSKGKLKEENRSVGVGLSNINQRLCLLYSALYGLTIQNAQEEGVIVEVTMPY